MQRFIDPCCGQCTHGTKTPCEKFIECRLEGPLCHANEQCRAARLAIVNKYAHSPFFREH